MRDDAVPESFAEKKLESRIDSALSRRRGKIFDGFDGNKTMSEVLDRRTVMTLYRMLKSGIISKIGGVVSAGKESVVLDAERNNSAVALKVYLVGTSNFKRRRIYIEGDSRFAAVRRGTRNMVELWARKEYRNLARCDEAGISVPHPHHVSGNVLVMDFVGNRGVPERRLLETRVSRQDYDDAIRLTGRLYRDARLVHGDLSEYNIFKTPDGLVPFDFGSAVEINHPSGRMLLERDINNITRFFARRGLEVSDPGDALGDIL